MAVDRILREWGADHIRRVRIYALFCGSLVVQYKVAREWRGRESFGVNSVPAVSEEVKTLWKLLDDDDRLPTAADCFVSERASNVHPSLTISRRPNDARESKSSCNLTSLMPKLLVHSSRQRGRG